MFPVSIVIPTHNRLSLLKAVLIGLQAQTYALENFEVIVVSDGSTDGTNEFLASYTSPLSLTALFQDDLGVAAARNRGVQEACGEVVLFLDDDVVPTPALIEEHLHFHNMHGSRSVVIGPMLAPLDFSPPVWVLWEHAMLAKQYSSMIQDEWQPTARQFYTGNTSLARSQFLSAGGFDTAFRRAEDVELAYRLADRGLKFFFNPKAVGYHYANRSFSAWTAIPYAYGVNDVIFDLQKGQHWLLPTLWREYHTRHPLVKSMIWYCLDRTRLTQIVMAALRTGLTLSALRKSSRLAMVLCSSIFNLRYYQGVADQLGGRKFFFAGVSRAAASHAS